ncbi:hypothetical protein L6452_18068 [Arctium lappa]|uniref:Uncharacterized protein n=1 Tax=Arctium lappa TaxID=4217 RepID=A0ACB9C555_ARCLA|nr:hypothetical protein L6452_18068 [Arctium lappa]
MRINGYLNEIQALISVSLRCAQEKHKHNNLGLGYGLGDGRFNANIPAWLYDFKALQGGKFFIGKKSFAFLDCRWILLGIYITNLSSLATPPQVQSLRRFKFYENMFLLQSPWLVLL